MTKKALLSLLLFGSLCMLAVLVNQASFKTEPYQPTPLTKDFNVIVVVIDTLSERALGLANPLEQRRFLSSVAKEGVVFDRAFAPSSWTRPSTGSILTGYHPQVHGATTYRRGLREETRTLAEIFKALGYQTAGFVSNVQIGPDTSFNRGYDDYQLVRHAGASLLSPSSELLTRKALDFLSQQARSSQSRFFLYLHYFDPHFHYEHHPEFDRSSWYKGALKPDTRWKTIESQTSSLSADDLLFLKDLYSEEIDYTDLHIEGLLRGLKSSPFAGNTVLIVTADHGEAFREHGHMFHGRSLYDELIHLPLILWAPQRLKPGTIKSWVSLMDIAPTLIHVDSGQAAPEYFGKPLPLTEPGGSGRELFLSVSDRNAPGQRQQDAIVKRPYKFIRSYRDNRDELYNLESDPLETNNLLLTEVGTAAQLRNQLEHSALYLASFERSEPQLEHPQGNAELQRLRSLGYLVGDPIENNK